MDTHADNRDAKRLKKRRGMQVNNRSLKVVQAAIALKRKGNK